MLCRRCRAPPYHRTMTVGGSPAPCSPRAPLGTLQAGGHRCRSDSGSTPGWWQCQRAAGLRCGGSFWKSLSWPCRGTSCQASQSFTGWPSTATGQACRSWQRQHGSLGWPWTWTPARAAGTRRCTWLPYTATSLSSRCWCCSWGVRCRCGMAAGAGLGNTWAAPPRGRSGSSWRHPVAQSCSPRNPWPAACPLSARSRHPQAGQRCLPASGCRSAVGQCLTNLAVTVTETAPWHPLPVGDGTLGPWWPLCERKPYRQKKSCETD